MKFLRIINDYEEGTCFENISYIEVRYNKTTFDSFYIIIRLPFIERIKTYIDPSSFNEVTKPCYLVFVKQYRNRYKQWFPWFKHWVPVNGFQKNENVITIVNVDSRLS